MAGVWVNDIFRILYIENYILYTSFLRERYIPNIILKGTFCIPDSTIFSDTDVFLQFQHYLPSVLEYKLWAKL